MRPALKPSEKMARVVIYLRPEERQQLIRAAGRRKDPRRSTSALVRRVLKAAEVIG